MTKGTPWPSVTIACLLPNSSDPRGWGRFLHPHPQEDVTLSTMNRSKSIASA